MMKLKVLFEKIFSKFGNTYEWLRYKLELLRLAISTHPRFIIFRLELFRWFPFLSKNIFKVISVSFVAVFFFLIFYVISWRSPSPFPDHVLVTVERGESLGQIATHLKEKRVIRSEFWLKVFVTLMGGQNKVIAGDYYFPDPKNIFEVSSTLRRGRFGLISVRVTLHEGLSSIEMADILEKELPAFSKEDFISEVESSGFEGYLFPDTYFFLPNTKASDVILTMRENFARQVAPFEEDILNSGKSMNDLVIMASIVEDEANSAIDTKRIVAGILWKRLRIEMPLQVDAPFVYYNGKNSYTLSLEDLKEDHPYNTYVNKGLPPTAITNPGIDSIRAAIAPTNTDYLFFMSDKSGNMYYAADFDGHQHNRERYLR